MSDTHTATNLISLASSIAAAIAAIAAWRAVRATNRGTDAQIVIQLRSEFSSSELHEKLKLLRSFKEKHGGEFSGKFIKLKDEDHAQFEKINDARRIINGYGKKVYILHKHKLINDELIRSLLSDNQFKFIMEVLEPYERAYAESDQNIKPDYEFLEWVSKHSA